MKDENWGDYLDPNTILLNPDLDCMEIDEGMILTLQRWEIEEAPQPNTQEFVEKAIEVNPGIWTAYICRAMHGIPQDYYGVAHCGMCKDYANPRKRARSEKYSRNAALPGFDRGQYELHPPCSRKGLSWLMRLTAKLVEAGNIIKKKEVIPDSRQPRGWDFGTRLYPKEKE